MDYYRIVFDYKSSRLLLNVSRPNPNLLYKRQQV